MRTDPTQLPPPRNDLDVIAYAVMQKADEETAKACDAAAAEVMGNVGKEHELPPLHWTYRPEVGVVSGLASDGYFETEAALAALQKWAAALKLQKVTQPDPGCVEYSGNSMYGLPVSVWAVVDRESWEANLSQVHG